MSAALILHVPKHTRPTVGVARFSETLFLATVDANDRQGRAWGGEKMQARSHGESFLSPGDARTTLDLALPPPLAVSPAEVRAQQHTPVVCCPYCLTPLVPEMITCAACQEDTRHDAPIELPSAELSASRKQRCVACAFPLHDLCVRCPRCRTATA